MRKILTILATLGLVACNQPTTIPNEDLANIFHDALLTNAYINQQSVKFDSLNIYEPILAKYGYTKEDLQYTLENFLRQKSAHLSDVIETVNDRLASEAGALRQAVVRLDTVRDVARRHARRTVYELEEPVVAKRKADTAKLIIKVPMQGAGEYIIAGRYSIDSKDEGTGRRFTANFLAGDSVTYHQYATVMHRVDSSELRTQFTLNRTMAEKYDTLRLHFNDFATRRDKRPDLSLVTIHEAKVIFTPTDAECIDILFADQAENRVFNKRFFEKNSKVDSLPE